MSVNSTSFLHHCAQSGSFISIIFTVAKQILVVPLSILVLYLGYQRCSTSTMSHSDIFTFNMAAVELIFAVGGSVVICGMLTRSWEVMMVGWFISSVDFPGEMSFHVLTCVDRYLAVVHPVTYLGLRQSRGVRIRNICIASVWLLCIGWDGGIVLSYPYFPMIPFTCVLVVSLTVVSFCSLCVLCVLIRPGPGEVGGDSGRFDQSKQRAFHTVSAIMGVLLLGFVGLIVCLIVDNSQLLSPDDGCLLLQAGNWIYLPSCLVSPLLFLHRAGKLSCWCKNKV